VSGRREPDEDDATTTEREWAPSERAYDEAIVATVERQRRTERLVQVGAWGVAIAAGVGTYLWLGSPGLRSLGLALIVAGVGLVAVGHEFVYGTDLVVLETDADEASVRETLRGAGNPLVAQVLLAADRVRTEGGDPDGDRDDDDLQVQFEHTAAPEGATGTVAFDGLDHTVYGVDGRPVQTFRVEPRQRHGTELLVRLTTHQPLSLSGVVTGHVVWRQYAAALRAAGFEVTESDSSLSLSPPDVSPVARPETPGETDGE